MQARRNLIAARARRRALGAAIDAFDLFEMNDPAPAGPPSCGERLGALRRDDVVTIGKTRWRVESNRYGLNSTYVVKAGTKGKKLYVLWATDLERCCLEVREVAPGTGTPVRDQAPLSKGCFVARADDKTWAGRRRRAAARAPR